MSEGKVILKFDVFPEEKANFEKLCKSLGITKIEFLRRAIAQVELETTSEEESICGIGK